MPLTTYGTGVSNSFNYDPRGIIEQGSGESDKDYYNRLAEFGGYNTLATDINQGGTLGYSAYLNSTAPYTGGVPNIATPTAPTSDISDEQQKILNQYGYDDWDSYMNDVNKTEDIYDEGKDYLDNLESNLYKNLPNYLSLFTDPYYNQIPTVTSNMNAGVANLQNQQGLAQYQEQDALSAARRLYNELTARNRQAFGGVSSVGQAASEIGARELQRQMGTVKNTAAQTIQGIVTKINEVKDKANTMIAKLKSDAELAKKEAQLAFQDKIAAINEKRYELKQQKAIDKINALAELRDRILSIQQVTTQKSAEVEQFRVAEINRIAQESAGYGQDVENAGLYGANQVGRQATINTTGQGIMSSANQLGSGYSSANSALQSPSGLVTMGKGYKSKYNDYETASDPLLPPILPY